MKQNRSVFSVLLAVMLVTGFVGSLPEAGAAKKKKKVERTEERQYVGFSGFRGAVEGWCEGEPLGCVIFPVEDGERFVSVEITDQAGDPVWASVYIHGYTEGATPHEHVCGASEGPMALGAGVEELVVVVTQTTGGATNPCAGAATTGVVSATFANLP